MEKGTHGREEKAFEDLSFSDQAKSLNGQIRTIEKAIITHSRKAAFEGKTETEIRNICVNQLK